MMAAKDESIGSLRSRIYYAARDDMAITLYALLGHIPKSSWTKYLEHPVEDDGHKCTPLIIAALNGNITVVKMLINHFSTNIEQEGTILLDGYGTEGATALWCAASAGHFFIVKFLIAHGADVNHNTRTNSSPLRAACYEGWMDIIEYLVDNGADVQKANNYNNTCLMIASYKNHANVVSYLLSKNTDKNAKAQCGGTALHFAAEHGHLEIVKILLECGTLMVPNNNCLTPILAAAERAKSEIVVYLIAESCCSKQECVDALELLGASYANDKDSYDLEKCYYFLHWAMTERETNPDNIAPKKILLPIPAYENHIECNNLSELEAIKNNNNALHMESLVIRERILGSINPEVPHPIIYRGALFADVGRFDRCVELWLHALKLRHQVNSSIKKDLLRFAQVFAQMLHIGIEVKYDKLKQVLEVAVEELMRVQDKYLCGDTSFENELNDDIYTALYLLVILTKVLRYLNFFEEIQVGKIVYALNKMDLRTRNGSTLLHLAINADTHVDEFHTKFVCKFPCAITASLLINCGADVNAVDNNGNSPLHIIVGYQKPITDFMTLHSIITKLIDAGCHIDRVNNAGESPFESVLTGVAEIILKTQFTLSLKCIAAKAVKTYNIPYKGIIPETLVAFTDMHGAIIEQRRK